MMQDVNPKKTSPRCLLFIFLVLPLAIIIIEGAQDVVAAEVTTIRLLEKVEINADTISLGAIAEIEDISRFPSYRNLSSYAGLVPCLDASADKSRTGRITKQGSPYLRSALVEAAQVIPRMKKTRLNLFFRKRIVRAGYQKAIVATAHKMLQVVYYVLKNQTPYQEQYSDSA